MCQWGNWQGKERFRVNGKVLLKLWPFVARMTQWWPIRCLGQSSWTIKGFSGTPQRLSIISVYYSVISPGKGMTVPSGGQKWEFALEECYNMTPLADTSKPVYTIRGEKWEFLFQSNDKLKHVWMRPGLPIRFTSFWLVHSSCSCTDKLCQGSVWKVGLISRGMTH